MGRSEPIKFHSKMSVYSYMESNEDSFENRKTIEKKDDSLSQFITAIESRYIFKFVSKKRNNYLLNCINFQLVKIIFFSIQQQFLRMEK